MKRSVLVVGAAIVVVAAGTTGAWLTRPPETASQPPPSRSEAAPAAASTPAPATAPAPDPTIALPESAPPPEPTSAEFAAPKETAAAAAVPLDWAAMPIDEVRARANGDEIPAMEELARRLVQGTGVAKDQQAGAGWLLRAAQRGSAQSAFNVGVMYERGFVVERDSTKAVEWYRKAVEANLPMAKHNLALLLRDGKGAPRNGKEAVELLRSAARQGMAASMFSLGDIYERGDAGNKDPAIAMAWFAITAEFERQTTKNGETPLGKMASQRVQVLQRVLMPGELERAQQFGQSEFKQIVETLQPPKPAPTETAAAAPVMPPVAAAPAADLPGWPNTASEQIRVIQEALVDLKLLRDKPDGLIGPMTRNAIRAFQRGAAMPETGEPTRDVFAALQEAITRRAAAAQAPAPARSEPPQSEPVRTTAPKSEPVKIDGAKAEPTKPAAPTATETAAAPPVVRPAATAPNADPPGWPKAADEQVRVVQQALLDLKLLRDKPDGAMGPTTQNAIRAFQRGASIRETGEPTRDVFAALQEAIARRDAAAAPAPPKAEPPQSEPVRTTAPKSEPVKVDAARAEPTRPAAPTATETVAAAPPIVPSAAAPDADPPGWPKAADDQVRVIQQALLDLKLLRDKPDGAIGPMTQNAIRAFQRGASMRETGEPTRDVFAALQEAIARRDAAAQAPQSEPVRTTAPKSEPVRIDAAKAEAAKPPVIVEVGKPEPPPPPPTSADIARATPKPESPKSEPVKTETAKTEPPKSEPVRTTAQKSEPVKVEAAKAEPVKVEPQKAEPVRAEPPKADPPKPPPTKVETVKPAMPQVAAAAGPKVEPAKPEPAKPAVAPVVLAAPDTPAPPTSADLARALPKVEPVKATPGKPDPNAWPTATVDQVKAIQALLRDLKFSSEAPDGVVGPATRTAIRDYERSLGLTQSGEPSKPLFESLKEMRELTGGKPK